MSPVPLTGSGAKIWYRRNGKPMQHADDHSGVAVFKRRQCLQVFESKWFCKANTNACLHVQAPCMRFVKLT